MIHILFFDTNILVCVKPRGVLSEGDGEACIPRLLAEQMREKGEQDRIFPVHRLDRETEGLMVFARTAPAAAALSRAIVERTMQKEYLAILSGIPTEEQGRLTDLLFYDRKRGKSFVVDRPRKGVKEAILDYRVVKKDADRALVRVSLLTGRTHQIRVQFASRGLPLVGDRRYGAPAEGEPLALYACRLTFPHPKTGEILSFDASPSWDHPCFSTQSSPKNHEKN